MEPQRLLTALTAANVALLWYQSMMRPEPSLATTVDAPGVLRGRALEIVDDRGKVVWNGKPYPETVLLRLMSPEGRPNVKLGASRVGAGLLIGGESDPTYVQVIAEGGESRIKLINTDSVERVITP